MKVFQSNGLACAYCGCQLTATRQIKGNEIYGIELQCMTPICKYYGIKAQAPELELKEI